MKNYSNNKRDEEWERFRQELQLMKDAVDCRMLLESLGFVITKETSKELRSTCKLHGGDNPTSFRFNKETRTWVCFSHKCHDILGHDIIALIRMSEDLDFMGAVNYLKHLVGDIASDPAKLMEFKLQREKQEFIREQCSKHSIPRYVTERHLKKHLSLRSNGFLLDGFKPETLDYFEIGGGYVDEEGDIRDIIPIRDVDGTLLAYSLRDIRRNVDIDYESKYKITPGLIKDKVLYNLNNAKELLPDKKLIVVEGFKSVWWLYEMGIHNVVAVMGSMITPGQQKLIYQYAHNGIVVLFDNDVPGIDGTNKAYEQMAHKIDLVPMIMYGPEGTDPADLDKEILYEVLKKYI